MNNDLNRFITAQQRDYTIALSEIKKGRKTSHWMWYIFPQIAGLGFSDTSKYYAVNSIPEARLFLNHEYLGYNLKEISNELLNLKTDDAHLVFGSPDHLKLKSCMTLFSFVDPNEHNVFKSVLDKFFNGNCDNKTIEILNKLNVTPDRVK